MTHIRAGNLSYLHDGSSSSRDSFELTVTDSTNTLYRVGRTEEATAQPSTIHIEISAVDDGTPILVTNRGLSFLQQENGKVFQFSKILCMHLKGGRILMTSKSFYLDHNEGNQHIIIKIFEELWFCCVNMLYSPITLNSFNKIWLHMGIPGVLKMLEL